MVNKSVQSWLVLSLIAAAVPLSNLCGQENVPEGLPKFPSPQRVRYRALVVKEPGETYELVADESAATPTSEYWLGIALGELPEIAKRQLGIEHGLVVDDVLQGSPAAKAEFKVHDILVKANDQQLKENADILKAVDASKGEELTLTLLRGGKEIKIKATPIKRPQPEAAAVQTETRPAYPSRINDEIKKLEDALQALRGRVGADPLGIWFAKPGVVGEAVKSADFPKNLTVQITKEGNQPAKIHVKRDDKEWEITEDKLGELPEDIRLHIQPMLGKGPLGLRMTLPKTATVRSMTAQPRPVPPTPAVPATPVSPPLPALPGVAPRAATPAVPGYPVPPADSATARLRAYRVVESKDEGLESKLDQILKKLDQMETRSIEQLQNEVKQLRKELDELRSK